MTNHRVSDLCYGHLGEAVYDIETKAWLFNRQPGRRNVLRRIGPVTEQVPPALQDDPDEHREQLRKTRKDAQHLARSHPQLVPAIPLLRPNEATSAAILSSTSYHDPTVSARFAQGKAADVRYHRPGYREVDVLAVVAGTAGDAIRLFRVRHSRRRWSRRSEAGLSIPEPMDRDDTIWHGAGAPVCQLCFAQSEGRGIDWLAARQPSSTTIFRALYHHDSAVRSPGPGATRTRPSRLNLNPVLSIPVARTGGLPHADITFNPWYNRQLAVVDQSGRWSVWDIEGRQNKRNTFEAKPGPNGLLYDDRQKTGDSTVDSVEGDGWGCILWAGSIHTLLVCNRRHMAVFHLASRDLTRRQVVELCLARSSTWILDVKRSPANHSHFYVLTSDQIFWIDVSEARSVKDEESAESNSVKVLLSWRHFRNSEDTSMQLTVNVFGEVSSLLLYSRINRLVTVFQFSPPSGEPLPQSVSDPYRLDIPPDVFRKLDTEKLEPLDPSRHISGMMLSPVQYWGVEDGDNDDGQTQRVRYFRLLVLCSDLSLSRCFYIDGPGRSLSGEMATFPSITIRLPHHGGKSAERAEDFIVQDGAESESDDNETESGEVSDGQFRNSTRSVQTVDLQWMYELAFDSPSQHGTVLGEKMKAALARKVSDEKDPLVYMSSLEKSIEDKIDNGIQPIQTLHDMQGLGTDPMDVDSTAASLREILQSVTGRPDDASQSLLPVARALGPPAFFGVSRAAGDEALIRDSDTPSLPQLYDKLTADYIDTLPASAPNKYRVATERTVRATAITLYLSSIGVQLVSPLPRDTRDEAALLQSQSQSFQLSVRTKGEGKERATEVGQSSQSQSQPPPPPHGVTSNIASPDPTQPSSSWSAPLLTPSLNSQVANVEKDGEDPASVRLRAYTSLTRQPRLPKTMRRLLSGWVEGGDAASCYVWQPLHEPEGDDDEEDGAEGTSQKLSARDAERRKRRREKLSKKEGHSQSQPQPQSQSRPHPRSQPLAPPSLLASKPWGSQPVQSAAGHQATGGGSSSQVRAAGDDDVPMTQVERGAFGSRQAIGRTATGERKRKRAAGF